MRNILLIILTLVGITMGHPGGFSPGPAGPLAQWVYPAALVAISITGAALRTFYQKVIDAKSGKYAPEEALKLALNIDDAKIQKYLAEPETVLLTSLPDDFSPTKLQNVTQALLRSIKLQEVLEETISACADRLDSLDKADPLRAQLEKEKEDLSKQYTELSTRMDVTRDQLTRAFKKMTLIEKTTASDARRRRAERFSRFITRVNQAISAGTPPSDHDSDKDTDSDKRTDILEGEGIPSPVGKPFPKPTPGLAPNRKPMEVPPPFEYDGDVTRWSQWEMEMANYVEHMQDVILDKQSVMVLFQNRTKEGSRAKRRMNALTLAVRNPAAKESKEWANLTTPIQTAQWIGDKLKRVFIDSLALTNARIAIRDARQGPLRHNSWAKFFATVDDNRLILGWSEEQALPYLLDGMNEELLLEVAASVGVARYMLEWSHLEERCVEIEDQIIMKNKAHHADEGLAGQYRKRKEERSKKLPAKAATETTVSSSTKVNTPSGASSSTRTKLDAEDSALVIRKGACWNCFAIGNHHARDCPNPTRQFTDRTRTRLQAAPNAPVLNAPAPPAPARKNQCGQASCNAPSCAVHGASVPAPVEVTEETPARRSAPRRRTPGSKNIRFVPPSSKKSKEEDWEDEE